MGWFSKPKKIDPNKVYDMMNSDYTQQMGDRAQQMIDPNSSLMQGMYNTLRQEGQNNLYTQNRLNRMNMEASGMGGQSGIQNAMAADASAKTAGNIQNQFQGMLNNNLSASNNLLGTAASNDMAARDASVSAYGQNITAENNYNSAMAGMAVQGAAMLAMCDKSMKENIKKIGNVKIKNGKKVPIYNFNYKGRKGKKTNVMAQDIQKVMPKAVSKGKNGLLYVDMNQLFNKG
ncbi:MAG: hypothetical protein Unbinned5179contig1000_18 [Prokaryotic dsDNA virus sp.]|nr:MAG: hypothetical protein Unbinned5179contig1000_18 [Prokaryotic dsDNA virus sp.]|tara:strand:+ start:1723 stop:2418 length:696 start_codon:yes stop_codon:yes gene_type:complete